MLIYFFELPTPYQSRVETGNKKVLEARPAKNTNRTSCTEHLVSSAWPSSNQRLLEKSFCYSFQLTKA